ncbi:hypothetical protein PVAND_009615 [Polypedilum vanderplanki]|uniref:Arf-GAP domain-containing protein n=1 Tax=Polypedilum vanderplanki TaxID=319348 RepID=A0A9J6CD33_POLVA|nr:hypothetical protein PVAND_009615 [Polypedilum vanderplanki]
MNKKDDKKAKLIQEKCNTILNQLLRDEDNKYCCDCDQKGPRWASWNLGIFLCIRCAGIHRNLGVHISRVKSVNLDTWSPEQVVCLQQMGNSRARAVYEALLSDNFRRPQTDSGLESFIRAKYEQKKYIAREWIPPPFPPKVNWDKEIEEELENQKRKKKASNNVSSNVTESTPTTVKPPSAPSKSIIPAPLPKPHSPKNSRVEARKSATSNSTNITDLLGLDTETPSSVNNTSLNSIPNSDHSTIQTSTQNENSLNFPFTITTNQTSSSPANQLSGTSNGEANNSANQLKQEEVDFFNQTTLENTSSGAKLTNDKILALYGNASSSSPQLPQFNINFQQHTQQQPLSLQDSFFYGNQQPAVFKPQIPSQQQHQFYPTQPIQSQPSSLLYNGNNNNFANFGNFGGTMQSQQINKLNEENIRKIESLNFNNFK